MILKQTENGKTRIVGHKDNSPDGYAENLQLEYDLINGETLYLSVTGLSNGYRHGLDSRNVWVAMHYVKGRGDIFPQKAFSTQEEAAEYIWPYRHDIIKSFFDEN